MHRVRIMNEPRMDMLDAVVAELGRRRGDLVRIAEDAGLSYDTVLRIRRRENDPGYSRVKRLAEVLGVDGAVAEQVAR